MCLISNVTILKLHHTRGEWVIFFSLVSRQNAALSRQCFESSKLTNRLSCSHSFPSFVSNLPYYIWDTFSSYNQNLNMHLFPEPHLKFFVPAPMTSSSMQETSDEGSVQFDSSSEESKIRYVIRVLPNKRFGDSAVTVEVIL